MKVRTLYFQAAAVAALMIVASAAHAQDMGDVQVRVEHAAARLIVIPEARNNVSVSVSHGASRLPELSVRQEGDHVVVDGGLVEGPFGGQRIRCAGSYAVTHVGPLTHTFDSRAVIVGGVGRVAFRELPVITARVPLNARVSGASAVFGEIGRTESLKLANAGCGDWTVGDVRGRLTVSQAGSGDVRAGAAGAVTAKVSGSGDLFTGPVGGEADVAVAGSGNVTLGAVQGGLNARLAGSGGIALASVGGPVEASIAASGDVRIHGGYAPHLHVRIAGSGDFSFDGRADSLDGSIVGSGDIYAAHVSGEVAKSVMGSGEVRVGR